MKRMQLTLKSKKLSGKLSFMLSVFLLPFLLVMSALSVVFDSFRKIIKKHQMSSMSRKIHLMNQFVNYNNSIVDGTRIYGSKVYDSFKKFKL